MMEKQRHITNVAKLIIRKASFDAICANGSIADGLAFLASKERIVASMTHAENWAKLAIRTIRDAAEPNPWKNASDEEIAGEILKQCQENRGMQ